jgi:proline iminopeptidase
MQDLYPPLQPYHSWELDVAAPHKIYVEESGNHEGIPVIFLHGGPGKGCNERHRRYFNPDKYRIVIFDQRGSGRSTPQGCTLVNTTHDLLADMELIRITLGIEKWLIYGGSWGAALGLLFAQQFPERITGMILRGTFLARKCDLDWFSGEGAGRLLPDYWEKFIGPVPEEVREDPVSAYYAKVHGEDTDDRIAAARAWNEWSGRVVTYLMVEGPMESIPDEKVLNEVSIETHYAKHHYFIDENQILQNAGRIPVVPIMIIHGRRDLTCTLDASWKLHRALPGSELTIVPNGGHLAGEGVLIDALVSATDRMIDILK